jgi:hypothetical protein
MPTFVRAAVALLRTFVPAKVAPAVALLEHPAEHYNPPHFEDL